ncbi:hypothetical protein [Devosia lacusdianchii]|uniref:hypothetical protein n=1 Tax=Devosia lacusdianchii TaxID=2917991 RepID=UPI001F058FA6|nr:hypothetical protein [Devosia sp. JXJ CY 41]
MLSHTTKLAGRQSKGLNLTPEEGEAMYAKGFRFSIYRPEEGELQLSRPYQVLIMPLRDELTITQP